MTNGFKAVAASFVAMSMKDGVKGYYLTDFVPSGADKHTSSENKISLQTLDEQGESDLVFTYHKGDKRQYATDGWYDKFDTVITKENDQFFPVGTGFWLAGANTLKYTTSGEVLMDSQRFDLVNGFRLVANPFPAKVLLTNIVPSGAEKHTSSENKLTLQTLDENGESDLVFTYHKGDKRQYATDGWYDKFDTLITEANNIEIPAGASLWVSGNSTLKLTVVTPFEDAE